MQAFHLNQFMEENDLVLSIFRSKRTGMYVACLEKTYAHGLTMKAVNDPPVVPAEPSILARLRSCSYYPIVWALDPMKAMVFLEETIANFQHEKEKLSQVLEEASLKLVESITDQEALYTWLGSLPKTLEEIPAKTIH